MPIKIYLICLFFNLSYFGVLFLKFGRCTEYLMDLFAVAEGTPPQRHDYIENLCCFYFLGTPSAQFETLYQIQQNLYCALNENFKKLKRSTCRCSRRTSLIMMMKTTWAGRLQNFQLSGSMLTSCKDRLSKSFRRRSHYVWCSTISVHCRFLTRQRSCFVHLRRS